MKSFSLCAMRDICCRAPVTDCCWSADGVYLATASSDRFTGTAVTDINVL
jgi:WD40 repeat protein